MFSPISNGIYSEGVGRSAILEVHREISNLISNQISNLLYKAKVLFPDSPTPSNNNFTTCSLALSRSSLSILSLCNLAALFSILLAHFDNILLQSYSDCYYSNTWLINTTYIELLICTIS